MAIKPSINKISTFDATHENEIYFSYNGSQPQSNTLRVLNTVSNEIVYTDSITTMKYQHAISANTLTNGVSYCAQISVDGSELYSDKVFFSCYSQPTFNFSDLSVSENANTISARNYDTVVEYSQSQGRHLREFQFILYDSTSNGVLYKSDVVLFNENSDIRYLLHDLENKSSYYVECIGTTVDDVEISTGKAKLYVNYNIQDYQSSFDLKCHPDKGYIEYSTNILAIDGSSDGTHTFENGYVKTDNNGIVYNDGFSCSANKLEIGIKGKNFSKNEKIFEISNGINKIQIKCLFYEGRYIFRFSATNLISTYVLYSDLMEIAQNEIVTIYIKGINGIYDMKIIK